MRDILLKVFGQTIQVTFLVFIMMITVDLINVWTRGKIGQLLKKGKQWRQYVIASFIGTIPGCFGAFTNVSLYIHEMISFGALVGAMVAVSGDAAFVMLAMFSETAILLFGMLFIIGIAVGWISDQIIKKWKIRTSENCKQELIHPSEHGFLHFFMEHIWNHIAKRHLWRTALWTFGALSFAEIGMEYWNLNQLTSEYTLTLLFLSALIGIIPDSGPHLIFVTMYAHGLIPFSVLFTSSVVQDGHGMLPMLAYSVKDSLLIKGFNIAIGLTIGLSLFLLGW
ncbi:MAG: arsenic efflux protein [Bacteroidetes bacterium]|nr:arsenic efflux protein [Bacteroidota bacterium]MBU1422648.1 arsenic efflux protein [Bacteroidota bacterium]